MRFYKLLYDDSNDDDIMCICEETYGIEQYELKEGKAFTRWNEGIVFHFDPNEGGRPTDYLSNNLGWFIVSRGLRNLIEELEELKVQYFPVTIMNKVSGEYLENYFVANLVNVLDAICLEHSKYSKFDLDGEEIISVQKYAIYKERLQEANVIKLKNDVIPIFVSEAFKIEVEKKDITGCDFSEVKVV
jgi:hypothetical protein